MTLTIKSSIKNLENSDIKNCSDVVKAVSDGALMGAEKFRSNFISNFKRFLCWCKDKEKTNLMLKH